MKRMFDLSASTLLLIIFFPVILACGLLIKMKLGSPILFKQERPGLNGKPFYLYKFRSMTEERNDKGHMLPDHIRLTSFGEFLRRYSLDELPQLINVIKGDLSLVGPRPLLMEYLPLYTSEQAKRHIVRPGITGWAQVNGRNALSWEEKFEHDVWYVNNRNLLLDLKILILTIKKVINSEGVNQPGNATMESFKGSKSTLKEGNG
ncbi:sugar transferase EpsL [Cytobacillus firmus]|uniref:Sugar transferase EpsL n=2 Tax=Cytobacillus TaxID=2675230 RepID=A0A366JMD3_CYTFI|nr:MULTISPECIES: sugar transferase [Cytobacillus]RBP88277.1 sugar transferase EpsL [Cytobacillus firmus]TDX38350.1 sugar transferase EpsL [Cytobacillus oceanisediminis]